MRTKYAAVSPAQPRPERPNRCRKSEEVCREGSSNPQESFGRARLAGPGSKQRLSEGGTLALFINYAAR